MFASDNIFSAFTISKRNSVNIIGIRQNSSAGTKYNVGVYDIAIALDSPVWKLNKDDEIDPYFPITVQSIVSLHPSLANGSQFHARCRLVR
jgi:hypothetical protein